MSLRSKMMLSTFIFMVLVVGLLTLNLYIDAAARANAEARRSAELLGRLATDWIRESAVPGRLYQGTDWGAVSERLSRSTLIGGWIIVSPKEGRFDVMTANDPLVASDTVAREIKRFREAYAERKTVAWGSTVYVPVSAYEGQIYVARFDLRPEAVPVYDMADTLKGILTIMALGTALLLLNAYIFVNRFVLRPLSALVDASNRVAQGDFSQKIPERETYDINNEMVRLERAFNLMMDQIGHYHRSMQDDIRKAREKITNTERRLFHAQRLSTTGTLAAGIAHEINNPLGGMLNAAQAIRSGKLDEAKRAEYLGLIIDGLERIRTIVQKILQFRPKAMEPQPIRIKDVVDRTFAFLEHKIKAKGAAVRNEVPEDLPLIEGDPLELQQAVLNVVMNAIDACVYDEGRIAVSGRAGEGAVRISIADNGTGMDERELSRCMDLFYTTKDVGEGTGLGLSVANNILENHGGKLEIESKKGVGTTVHFVLPLMKGSPASSVGTIRIEG